MTFEEARAAYPVLERFAYLNAGSSGPLARATADAVAAERVRDLEEGRSSPPFYERMLARRKRARELFADEIGVPAANVALTRATTDGCNIVLNGLGLGPDDEVVTTDQEHFGLAGALGASDVRVRVARMGALTGEAALAAILAEVGPRTRLLALSHVLWTNGHVMPVRELKDTTRLPVLVDGAQAVGAFRVDASAFDFYTVSGQKWLCCPDSSGALYVRDPEALRVTFPSYFSQQAYEPDGTFTARAGTARFDNGWLAVGLLAGIEAALTFHPAWRFERAAETAVRCRELLAERFEVVTAPEQGTLVSFRVDGNAADTAKRIYERGVVIRDVPKTNLLRVSCGYWTSDEDLERLVAALGVY